MTIELNAIVQILLVYQESVTAKGS